MEIFMLPYFVMFILIGGLLCSMVEGKWWYILSASDSFVFIIMDITRDPQHYKTTGIEMSFIGNPLVILLFILLLVANIFAMKKVL